MRFQNISASSKERLAVCVLLLLQSIVMTYPSITYLSSGVAGREGDNLFYVWQLWWVKHSLLDLRISPFFDPFAYYPVGYQVASGELTPANTFLFLPVTAIGGPVVSYNVCLLFSFFASALGAYLWVEQLTSRRSAALVAGVVFGFLPYRYAHLPGHLELMSTQWIPLSLFALERFIASHHMRWAIAIGVGLTLIALSSWYYAYSALLLLPLYILMRARPWREHWSQARWWRGLLVIGLIILVLVVPFALPYYQLFTQGQLARDLDEAASWSLNPYDFFIPNLSHPLLGRLARTWFPQQAGQWPERGVCLGIAATVLGMIGLCQSRGVHWAGAIIATWIMSFMIALGPTLHWGGAQVSFPSLDFVPLPAYALYKLVPLGSSMRVMSRFGVWTGLMTAALASWGACWLVEKVARHRSWRVGWFLLGLIMLTVLFESYGMVQEKTLLWPRPVDLWLAQSNPSPIVILELPLQQALRSIQNYYATVHQQAMVLGPAGDSFYSVKRSVRSDRLRDFPAPASLEALKTPNWQLSYVLFTPAQIENWAELRQAIEATDVLRFERVEGDVWVYRVQR